MLVKAVEGAINEADPIGLLALGAPSDEYAPEIGTIIPRLVKAQDVDEVTAVLHEEFLRWFGNNTTGPRRPMKQRLGRSGKLYSNTERASDTELLFRLPCGGG
jgi:hypothetical protein